MQLGGWVAPCVGLWVFGFWCVVVLWHLWLVFESTFERLFRLAFERFPLPQTGCAHSTSSPLKHSGGRRLDIKCFVRE